MCQTEVFAQSSEAYGLTLIFAKIFWLQESRDRGEATGPEALDPRGASEHYRIYIGRSNSWIPITFNLWDLGKEFKSYEEVIIMKFILTRYFGRSCSLQHTFDKLQSC